MTSTLIIVPCRNESGNIRVLIEDFIRERNSNYKLYLVEGGSSDDTEDVCKYFAEKYANSDVHFLKQLGIGKFAAVRTVISHATDKQMDSLVAIWDADHSIKFHSVKQAIDLASSSNSFVFTERLGATMEPGAMPNLNFFGNFVIAKISTLVFDYSIKDALSGTKVFPLRILLGTTSKDFDRFLNRDSYGDLSYFLAAKINKMHFDKIKVSYFARVYGQSGLKRFSNGLELLYNLFLAFKIIKKAN